MRQGLGAIQDYMKYGDRWEMLGFLGFSNMVRIQWFRGIASLHPAHVTFWVPVLVSMSCDVAGMPRYLHGEEGPAYLLATISTETSGVQGLPAVSRDLKASGGLKISSDLV